MRTHTALGTVLALRLYSVVIAQVQPSIEMWKIGIGTVDVPARLAGTDQSFTLISPFDPNSEFDLINANDCYYRFQCISDHNRPQVPSDGNGGYQITPQLAQQITDLDDSARVTHAQWRYTRDDVYDTIKHNGPLGQLWLSNAVDAFQYTGLLTGGRFAPQSGLNDPLCVVSIILPSGVAKLQLVSSSNPNDGDVMKASGAGIIGINGDLDPATDYAYAYVVDIAEGLRYQYPRGRVNPTAFVPGPKGGPPGIQNVAMPASTDRYFKAIRADGRVVVVDLRSMPGYINTQLKDTIISACERT